MLYINVSGLRNDAKSYKLLKGYYMYTQGFIQDLLVGGKKFVGHCHSVMHEYETIL